MIGITPRQAELLQFLIKYIGKHNGVAPSFSEMSEAMNLGRGGVFNMLEALEQRGRIKRIPNKNRAIEILQATRTVPLNREIFDLTMRYALAHGITVETAANELLRTLLGAA